MSEFKERANLRTASLKDLLGPLEKERDSLLDEAACLKGQIKKVEEIIRRMYEKILDINKEEQIKEEEAIKQLAFIEASKGVKTPRVEKRK